MEKEGRKVHWWYKLAVEHLPNLLQDKGSIPNTKKKKSKEKRKNSVFPEAASNTG